MSRVLLGVGTMALVSACSFDLAAVTRPGGMQDANPIDAAMPDASAADGASDAGCANMASIVVPAEADTIIASGLPTINFGNRSIANVNANSNVNSVGLFRFDASRLPLTARIQAATVTLTFAATSNNCAAACGSCTSFDHDGNLTLFAMRSDWVELQTNWTNVAMAQLWGAAGASQAGVDRSATPLASVPHVAGRSEQFRVDPTMLSSLNTTWRQNDKVSFEVVPSNSAVMYVATRESAIEACVQGGYPPASLEIFFCP
jgi:hypothetical protein